MLRRSHGFMLCVSVVSILSALSVSAQEIDYSGGFNNTSNLTANQNYVGNIFTGGVARLTDGEFNTAASVFYNTPVNVVQFTNTFTFRIYSNNGIPGFDGFTFAIQNDPRGRNAIGNRGGNLGYSDPFGASISKSVAVKFDIYQNIGSTLSDPPGESTGVFTNGQTPIGGSSLNGTGINLKSGNVFRANMSYSNTTLNVTITDTVTLASASQIYTGLDIPTIVGAGTAYVGFTAGTGLDPTQLAAVQDIQSWRFVSPVAVPELGASSLIVAVLLVGPVLLRRRRKTTV